MMTTQNFNSTEHCLVKKKKMLSLSVPNDSQRGSEEELQSYKKFSARLELDHKTFPSIYVNRDCSFVSQLPRYQ